MTSKGYPAIVASAGPAEWQSCRIITPNLSRAYRGLWGARASWHSLTPEMHFRELRFRSDAIWKLAGEIHAVAPDRIVFLDHAPHPKALLLALSERYGKRPLPPLHFHVYGDFTLYLADWLRSEPRLRGAKVRFICASERQRALVSRFMSDPGRADVDVCPFPVDPVRYRFDPDLRSRARSELGADQDDILILYTGRISMQKNTLRLAREVIALREATGLGYRLVLAGGFDDIGAPFFGIEPKPGQYYGAWREFVDEHSSRHAGAIFWLGSVGHERLAALYNAADAFASLSLHHDEDFGMSPAEALCTGLPCVLTSWGGYASFQDPTLVNHVPVEITSRGLKIHGRSFRKSLFSVTARPIEARLRAGDSMRMQASLGLGAIQERLRALHAHSPPQFSGFGWRAQKLAEAMHRGAPFMNGARAGSFYEEIYGVYARD